MKKLFFLYYRLHSCESSLDFGFIESFFRNREKGIILVVVGTIPPGLYAELVECVKAKKVLYAKDYNEGLSLFDQEEEYDYSFLLPINTNGDSNFICRLVSAHSGSFIPCYWPELSSVFVLDWQSKNVSVIKSQL